MRSTTWLKRGLFRAKVNAPFKAGNKRSNGSQIILSVALITFFIAFFAMKVDISIQAHGYLEIKDKNIVVEHPIGGRVDKLFVREGQEVEKGQPLAVIDNSYVSEEYSKNKALVLTLQMRMARINAEIEGKDFVYTGNGSSEDYAAYRQEYAVYLANKKNFEDELKVSQSVEDERRSEISANETLIDGLRQQLNYDQKQVKMVEELVRIGAAAQGTLLTRRSEAQKTLNDLNNAISKTDILRDQAEKASLDTEKIRKGHTSEKQNERLKVQDQLSEAQAKLSGAHARKQQEQILSPVRGKIQKLTKSHEGSVIPPGGEILEITPRDVPVVASVKLDTKDRDKIWVDMPVKVEINGFERASENSLKGKVILISADSFSEERGAHYYQVEISIDQNDIKEKLYPGMAISAYFLIGKRTISEYFFKPFLRGAHHALSEP
ncbi:HlyD family type I secretion periplasmic adaptor subunit [Brucella anthropi]|uniref:HlyD family type I secretion periplasmic adaptor subunit n=1 Tax=Brucella anthropi TaxID=529 RepID=UPI00235E41DD|nr:HlyD family type I secretion periplasmic adaptor subunit [Brucella anthropi]